ncbi:hypothetical protein GCM10009845_35180 [Pedococcus bigeumensis]
MANESRPKAAPESAGNAEAKGTARPDRFRAATQTALRPLRCVVCGVAWPKIAGIALDVMPDGRVLPGPVCTACMAKGGGR